MESERTWSTPLLSDEDADRLAEDGCVELRRSVSMALPTSDTKKYKTTMPIFATFFLGFTMALDFSIVIISIQSYWLGLGGKASVYGIVFGCYDLASMLGSPILGYLSDSLTFSPKWGGLKFAMILGTILNGLGNAVYSCAWVADTYALILLGRLLAGFGSAAMANGLTYLTKATTTEQRGPAIATYKLYQAFARMGGPLVGFCLVLMPEPDAAGDLSLINFFNFYTIPGWIASANALLIMLPMLIFGFENPKSEGAAEKVGPRFEWFKAKDVLWQCAFLSFVQFAASVFYWAIGSNLLSFALGQYHMIHSQRDLWQLYVSGIVGFVLAFALLNQLIKWTNVRMIHFVLGGLGLFVLCYLVLLVPQMMNSSDYYTPNMWIFFVGSGVGAAGTAWFFPGINAHYSQIVSRYRHQARDRMGTLLSMANLNGAAGRFLEIDARPGRGCQHSNRDQYFVDGCFLTNLEIVLPILAGSVVIIMVLTGIYTLRWSSVKPLPPSEEADTHHINS